MWRHPSNLCSQLSPYRYRGSWIPGVLDTRGLEIAFSIIQLQRKFIQIHWKFIQIHPNPWKSIEIHGPGPPGPSRRRGGVGWRGIWMDLDGSGWIWINFQWVWIQFQWIWIILNAISKPLVSRTPGIQGPRYLYWLVFSALFWDIGTLKKHENSKVPESARLAGKSLIEYLGVFCPNPYIKISILRPKLNCVPRNYNYINFYRDPLRGILLGTMGQPRKPLS